MIMADILERHLIWWYIWNSFFWGYIPVGLGVWYHTRWWDFTWWQRLLYGFVGSWFALAFNIVYQGMLNPLNPREDPRCYFRRQMRRRA